MEILLPCNILMDNSNPSNYDNKKMFKNHFDVSFELWIVLSNGKTMA